jgi:uncharacterized phage protein gp47/JayE
MATLACTIDANGITAPSYTDILTALKSAYQSIYGSDIYIEPDSQDGQLIAVFAQAINDCNQATISVYNSFSPAKAQGVALSSNVKINGIARHVSSNSTVDVTIVGVAGSVITNGIVEDTNKNRWDLPPTVTIPAGGLIIVTATCETAGAIAAAPGTVTQIVTPTRGWQSVTNASSAAPGASVETDAALRKRQASSTALPSLTILEGVVGGVASVAGVTRFAAYENDTDSTDSDGLPSHSMAIVVEGGDATEIATVIATKKAPGTGTFGTTSETVIDSFQVIHNINFFRPTDVPIIVQINLTKLPGYTDTIGDEIKAAVASAISNLSIGGDVLVNKLYSFANLPGTADGATFDITSLLIARDLNAPAASNVSIAFNEVAVGLTANITITAA